MQFIKKNETTPEEWEQWFTTGNGVRSFNYGADYQNLPNISQAKEFLLNEQSNLCAYCQRELKKEEASIEHIIPKSHNLELSTNYFNLVAVCKETSIDPNTGRKCCEPERGNRLLPPIFYYQDAQVTQNSNHRYFVVYQDGTIAPKHDLKPEIKNQVQAFIEILNLNHSNLSEQRSDMLKGILDVFVLLDKKEKNNFLQAQMNRLLHNTSEPFRQYLLIYIATRRGIN